MPQHNTNLEPVANNIRVALDILSTHIGTIQGKLKTEILANDQSLSLLLETKMLQVLNLTYDLAFQNANLLQQNQPGIDGVDHDRRLMIQVTATSSNEKINHTIERVIDHGLYERYDRLMFVMLSDKRKLTEPFKKKIAEKIDGRFSFEPDTDIIDFNDIFRTHHSRQDLGKIHTLNGLLEEVFNYRPIDKTSGFSSISVSFDDEESENVYWLIDALVREGVNVYCSSNKVYERFRSERHPFRDYIIFVQPGQSYEHLQYCLSVLSNNYIKDNFENLTSKACHLLKEAKRNESRIEVITFDRFVNRVKSDTYFNSHMNVRRESIRQTVQKLLLSILKEATFGNIRMEEIKQELINTNRNFSAIDVIDTTSYSLLNLKMNDQDDIEINYLLMTRDYKQSAVIQHFERNYKKQYSKNLNILVPKDFNQRTRRRLDGFKGLSNKVYYIDEHLYDKRYKSFKQERILGTEDYVSPVVRYDGELLGVNDIIYWIRNDSESSVAILTGSGGIGKTTVCEKIHDLLLDDHERIIVIFIDAARYISFFKQRGHGATSAVVYDLYSIFEACHPHANIIDKNSFYVNYALGNIVIIFDGIDEVISTIPSFSLNRFLTTLNELKLRIGKGKILINCRDAYVHDLKVIYKVEDSNIRVYELMAFDTELAKKYFSKHFIHEQQIRGALRLAQEFFPDDKFEVKHKYPPFILEIIIQLVNKEFNYASLTLNRDSDLLHYEETFDTIISQICQRENIKKEENGFQLDIHHQLKFMCYLAIEEKGEADKDVFEDILQQIGLFDRLKEVVLGLRDHPLLITTSSGNNYHFRFEFFKTNFQALAILNMLYGRIELPMSHIFLSTIAHECNFNSVISKIILEKVRNDNINESDLVKHAKGILRKGMAFEMMAGDKVGIVKKKFTSNIFLLVFKMLGNPSNSASIIQQLFQDETGRIVNFCFYDVPDESGIRLDFSNLYFSSSYIDNYDGFFYCSANSDTFFDETCAINNVFSSRINTRAVGLDIQNFDKNIRGDNSVFRILSLKRKDVDLIKFFKEYLKTFQSTRQFVDKDEKSIDISYDDYISVELLTRILQSNNVVTSGKMGAIRINERLKVKINKFLKQGFLFTELSHSITQLKLYLLSGKVNDEKEGVPYVA